MNTSSEKKPDTETSTEKMEERPSSSESETKDELHLKLEAELIQARQENFETKKSLDEAQKKIHQYESKISEIRGFVKKLEEEVELVRDRARRDQEKEIERRFSHFLIPFLEILDNFERSFQSCGEDNSSFVEGMKLVYKQLLVSLEKLGVKKIDSLSQVFDPQLHEAVTTTPVEDPEQDSRVQTVLREGYVFGDRVLRPAQVIVGKAS